MSGELPSQPPIDERLKAGMEAVLKGEQINTVSDNWRIENLNSPTIFNLSYKKGDNPMAAHIILSVFHRIMKVILSY